MRVSPRLNLVAVGQQIHAAKDGQTSAALLDAERLIKEGHTAEQADYQQNIQKNGRLAGADSADAMRRNRGRRGLDILKALQEEQGAQVRIDDTDFPEAEEVDLKLLRLAESLGGALVTNDFNLNKVAAVQNTPVLNINELASAVRPVLLPGEALELTVLREGKEPGQGVGFLEDGTMVIIDGGRRYIGERVELLVTSSLQTSAGRLIFARLHPRAGAV